MIIFMLGIYVSFYETFQKWIFHYSRETCDWNAKVFSLKVSLRFIMGRLNGFKTESWRALKHSRIHQLSCKFYFSSWTTLYLSLPKTRFWWNTLRRSLKMSLLWRKLAKVRTLLFKTDFFLSKRFQSVRSLSRSHMFKRQLL